MSYLVLARKWRPQSFEDIVGQSFACRTLQNAITSGRVAHAFLFTGARGVGKTSMARILAKSMNCVDGPTTKPCGVCENCKEISEGNSIDVLEIDGASNRGIDEIRELRENIKYFPSKSKHKIYIIDEVHMLTKEAFNALLKTLEEPPAHAIFIFATTEPHKIPITILSRCQRYDFKKISLSEICGHLKRILKSEGIKISDASVLQIAKAANGSMRDSQSILDQIISYGGTEISDADVNSILGVIDRALIYEIVGAVIRKDADKALRVINSIHDYGHDINQFCFNILEAFRDIVAFKSAKDPGEIIDLSEGELNEIKTFADEIDVKELLLIFNILYKAEEEITRSMTPKILLEMSVLKMINRFRVLPLAAIVKKLDALEKKIVAKGGDSGNSGGFSRPAQPAQQRRNEVRRAPEPAPRQARRTESKNQQPDTRQANTTPPPPKPVAPEQSEVIPAGERNAEGFVQYLKKKSILLYSHIEPLSEFEVTGDEINISASDKYFLEYFESQEIQMSLKELAYNYFDRNLKIIIKTVEKSGKNSLYSNDKKKTKGAMMLEAEHSDPIFTKAKQLFEGEIVDFKNEK